MISGIGVDLVDKARFINLVKKFGNRVATKILSKDEYLEYKDRLDHELEIIIKIFFCNIYQFITENF